MIPKRDHGTILVVDDEPENIWPLIKHLEADFDVLCATGGEQALRIARSGKKPDLILLDVMMPGMDGYEVCSLLKADDSTRDIPVIFLTAKKEDVDETTGFELGAQDYVSKPFSLPVVRARIRSVLNLKREMDRRLLLKTRLERLNAQLEDQALAKMDELEKTRAALKLYEDKYHRLFREEPDESGARRILVVDDNPENVHILIHNLRAQYEIICAANGEAALECAFSDNPPDLILLDIMMPGMDGFEAASRLKANPNTRDIPVIFVTALGREVDEARGLNLGAVDFITKPYSVPAVDARIKAALRLKDEMDRRVMLTRELEGLNKDLEKRVMDKTTALQQAREDLLASEKKYRDIYENAPEGIFQADFEGRVLSANPAMARILGYSSPDELLAKVSDIRHHLHANAEKGDLFAALLSEQPAIVGRELQFNTRDNKVVWVSASIRVARDAAGNPLFLEGFLADIDERKLLEEQLRHAAKMEAIGNLVGGIAHDFNNLMTTVIGYSELLLRNMQKGDPGLGAVKLIKQAGESAAKLTHRLLAFGRKQVLQPVPMDLNTAVGGMEKMLQHMIGEDVELVASCSPGLRRVMADPSQIEQVIMNLAVNARDAMPGGGKLSIETANVFLDEAYCRERVGVQPGEYVMLAVSDTGAGMDSQTLSRLFEPFFTTKGRDRGTGLGLATVYGIVKQSRSHIWVHSVVGKGSTFKVYFPAIEMEAAEPAELREPPVERGGAETIMLAEDNVSVRELAVAILEEHGYTVLAADSGQACLNKLIELKEPVDLLLTDVVMPDMNGKTLFHRAREHFPGLRVLFMSGYTDNVIVRHGVLEEGFHFIQKPFAVQDLAAKVREVLDS